MHLELDGRWVINATLAATRIGGVLMFTSVLGFATLPMNIRILLVLGLSVVIWTTVPVLPEASVSDLPSMVTACFSELLLGSSMAFGMLTVFGAFAVGGKLLDYQMGFGIATLFDPTTATQSSLNGTFLAMLAAVVFLAVDAHHVVLRAIAYTFSVIPVGKASALPMNMVIAQAGLMFTYGVMLVAPIVAVLMLIDLGTGVASRLMPQVSAYFVVLPVKIVAGFIVFAVALRFMGPFIENMFSETFLQWQRLLGGIANGG